MAGLTSTFHHPCKFQFPKPLTFHIPSFSFRIHTPTTTRFASISTTISARYGGSGGWGGPRRSNASEDEALDFSAIRSDSVRLIDEQQKMVGIVSKAQAFQMAEDAELDLIDGLVYNIDVHDYSVRLKAAKKFLKDSDKVKVIVSLKGRENEFRNNAIELIRRFQNDVGELAIEEAKNFKERNIFIILVPNKAVLQKSQELPNKKDNSMANEVSAGV